MDCGKCHELLSDFLDGTLNDEDRALFGCHLEDCLSCAGVREEIHAIVGAARESQTYLVAPRDARALWQRIRDTVEAELEGRQAVAAAAAVSAPVSAGRESLWSRLMGKRWELSLPQLTAAVAALVVSVSLVTALGVQGLTGVGTTQQEAAAVGASRLDNKGLRRDLAVDAFYPQGYVRQQQVSINYWTQRVEQRKASWNPRMRAAFERSLSVIDQAVNDSLTELDRNPHDEVSEEMLGAALRDKMKLLREFSEQ